VLRGLARGALGRRADHHRGAGGAEAVEGLDDLRLAHHDCEVVTADAPLDSSLLPDDEDSEPPDDSVAVEDSVAVDGDDELVEDLLPEELPDELLDELPADVLMACFVERAGSCPDASWT